MRMLIVDDSRTMRHFLASIAGQLEFETAQAVDGQDALDQLNGNLRQNGTPFDMALVDWDMPGMSGVDLVREIRKQPAYACMKVMMVTSHNALADVRLALNAGADDFVMKPLDAAMLAGKLHHLGFLDA